MLFAIQKYFWKIIPTQLWVTPGKNKFDYYCYI
jgi:hypothetical protein